MVRRAIAQRFGDLAQVVEASCVIPEVIPTFLELTQDGEALLRSHKACSTELYCNCGSLYSYVELFATVWQGLHSSTAPSPIHDNKAVKVVSFM